MSPSQPTLIERVAELFPDRVSRILVAVSGGVDSVVLLHVLKTVSSESGCELHVAHLDHQLRQESHDDADFVADLCQRWELPCHIESCNVQALANQDRISLEMAGRKARQTFLSGVAEIIDADLIALAHHRDDQAETFMLRLIRGTGQSGLTCMYRRQSLWWRPLLDCDREEILAYARQHGLHWVEDRSNQDQAFLRNRIRTQIMPQMKAMNPRSGVRIAETVQQLQLEENFWQDLISDVFPRLLVSDDDGLRLSRPGLIDLHQALRFRIYREALRRVRGDLQKIELVHLRAIENMLLSSKTQAQLDLPDCWVARRYESLWIRNSAPVLSSAFVAQLLIPGETVLPNGQVLRASLQNEQEGESQYVAEFAYSQLEQPVSLRYWQAGDSFAPQGMGGHKKLKRYFSDQKIELEVRANALVLLGGETILWVVGMRRSRHAPASMQAEKILRLELIR